MRTSPPLNMAQNSQSNRNLKFYVSIWLEDCILLAFFIIFFQRHNQSQTSACLSINNKTMNFEGGFVLLWIWLTWIFINQKCKTSSCHVLKIYMKISLNNRRMSPPLNIAHKSKRSLHLDFIFNLIGGPHSLFIIFKRHNQSRTSACLSINNKTLKFEGRLVLLWIWLTVIFI